MTKGADRKSRLDQRHARIAASSRRARWRWWWRRRNRTRKSWSMRLNELCSQLKKVERAEALACDKEEWDKAKRYSTRISEGCYLKQPKAVTLVQTKKRKKSMKMENIRSADEEDETWWYSRRISPAWTKSALYQHEASGRLSSLFKTNWSLILNE